MGIIHKSVSGNAPTTPLQRLRVAACAINQTPLDWDANAAHIVEGIQLARQQGVQLICFPELSITGYGCEDAFQSTGVIDTAWDVLMSLLPATEGMLVALGLPIRFERQLYNCAALVSDRQLVGLVGKQNLAGDGLHYEPRWFRPWPNHRVATLERGEDHVPLGDLIFDVDGLRIGFEICEDAWVLQRPGGELASLNVDVILNPSASHFAFGKHRERERLVLEGSLDFQAAYVYANHLGNEAGRAIYDGDCFLAAYGRLLSVGPRFGYRDVYVISAEVDLTRLRSQRVQSATSQALDDRPRAGIVAVPLPFPARTAPRSVASPDTESAANGRDVYRKEEEFTRAVALALFDYLRKSKSQGFVVSLSGGADSSAVALLVYSLVQFAVAELGWKGFRDKLDHIGSLREVSDVHAAMQQLLTCAYQSTRNSSEVTRGAAESIARSIHATYHELAVDAIVQQYVQTVESAIGRRLTWEQDDIALQNIQARVRAPSVWLLANLRGALLLSTSNRSEAAVGYATMDGDTCGGLAPIAGIDKAFLRVWLRWMEKEGPAELGPQPELACVNRQQPTAELRPPGEHQTDEADLMPYPVLDAVERAGIRDKLTPWECLQRLGRDFPQYSLPQRAAWVERFFQLWCRNQWKRERYAPSFHLDDENLDPKTWCRFPILSGGYERELREMYQRAGLR